MLLYFDKTQPIELPDCFSVGFARQEVTPPIPYHNFSGHIATEYHDPITATVISLCDGEEVVLLCSIDVRAAEERLVTIFKNAAFEHFDIPKTHAILNATHNHNGPDVGCNYSETLEWFDKMKDVFPELIKASLQDVTPASAFGGKAYTQGLNFVRRYLLSDHTWEMNPTMERMDDVIEAESKADNEMRVIKFEREGKKPVCLVNWQCHAASSHGTTLHSGCTSHLSTADYLHKFREGVEKEYDVLFSFHQGAAGNIIGHHRFNELSRCRTEVRADEHPYEAHGRLLVPYVGEALQNMQPLKTGKLRVNHKDIFLPFKHIDPQTLENAKTYWEAGGDRYSPERLAMLEKFGLKHYECNSIIIMSRLAPATGKECAFTAVSFGDIGIATSPFEMFDQNGKEVREASPYKMTFSLAYTDGMDNYLPSYWAFIHGSYEVYSCMFEPGTGEKCADHLVHMLLDNYLLDHPAKK